MAAIPGKNPDHLVQAHRIARDRVSRGLRSWKKSIALKAIVSSIEDCEDPEKLVAGCKSIASLLKAVVPESHLDMCSTEYESRISEALELLEGIDVSDFEDPDDGLSNVNYWLSDIYDYCDIHRIWIDG
ncbi:hypothetical protein CL689_06285 [Candidatus Saccharibacteria bacterium]|nr:hypothetical protein [Candidatus Saccharibacteria bacterium]|tara:strand:+ start:3366 stop:3752 length:387 start_codon:yes stop_codon:yes gene_type:complete